MRRVILILGGVAALASIGAVALSYFALIKADKDRNKRQTEAARAARWQKNGTVIEHPEEIKNEENEEG